MKKLDGGVMMETIDEKVVTLHNGVSNLEVKVYLKEVFVRGGAKKIKAFCKVKGGKGNVSYS